MASKAESVITTFGNEQKETEYQKDRMHGFMYQVKILMLFVNRGLRKKHEFNLYTEMESAQKFDDLVYEYIVDQSKTYRFLQAKHNKRGDKEITEDHLLTESDGDYSLVKYFFSYREIKEEKQLEGNIEDVIVFTNINFDHKILPRPSKKLTENFEYEDATTNNNFHPKIRVKPIEHDDDAILKMNHKLPRKPLRCRFGQDALKTLTEKANSYYVTKLAQQLVKCLLKHEVIREHQEPFNAFHMILAKEVISITDNTFQSNFLNPLSEKAFKFRTIFKEVFEIETNNEIYFGDLNKAIGEGQLIKSKKIGLKLSNNFGNKEEKKTKKNKKAFSLKDLATELVKCLLNYKTISHQQGPFEYYHKILAEEVICIPENRFQSNFLEAQEWPVIDTGIFRTIFKDTLEKETEHKNDKIEFAKLNEAISSKKVGLKFSKFFGKKEKDAKKNNEKSSLEELATELVNCLLNYKAINHDQDPFKDYHIILAKEVISIPDNRFQNNFLEGKYDKKACPLQKQISRFRAIFKEAFEEETDHEIVFTDLNKAIDARQEVRSKKIGLKIPENFGKTEAKAVDLEGSEEVGDFFEHLVFAVNQPNEDELGAIINTVDLEAPEEVIWPKNTIREEEVKDFFDHLVFAVNQPNEDELGAIIKKELCEGFDEDFADKFYGKLQDKMIGFLQGKDKDKFASSLEWKKFFDTEKRKKVCYFRVNDPISLFTGRTDQLNKLHEMLQKTDPKPFSHTVSISGLGGIGKSEMVRKYISLHKSVFDNRVIWLDAVSHEKLSKSFKELASEKLKISLINSHDQSPKNIKSIVDDVYTHFSAAKSLFIFDNTDEVGLNDITEFLPCSLLLNKPYVVITSRNREWGPIPVLYLDVLTNSEAMELIKAPNINSDAQDNEISMLAETLQFFPLALQQALVYIKVTDDKLKIFGKKFGIMEYLNRFEKDPLDLLNFGLWNISDGDKYPETFSTIWNKTIEKIRDYPEIGEIAIDILNIIAFLGSDDIPTCMFLPMRDNLEREETIGSAVQLLKKFSIVSSGQDPMLLNIHSLLQLVTRHSLSKVGKESLVKVCTLSLSYVSEIVKDNQHSSRHKFATHLEKLLSNLEEWCSGNSRDRTIELSSIVPLLAAMREEYNAIGYCKRAEFLQERELTFREYWHVRETSKLCTLLDTLGGLGEPTKANC